MTAGTQGGYDVLGEQISSVDATLGALDIGTAMQQGGNAVGRRVMLPLATQDLDVDDLTADGKTLIRRSLEWGYGSVAHWKLDETSGTTAADSVGGHDGTVSDGTWSSSGRISGAMEFDGTDDFITVANATPLQLTNKMTITAWIKGDAWGTGNSVNTILRKGGSDPVNWQLAITKGKVSLTLDDTDDAPIIGATVLTAGEWSHVAATWDGPKARVYVDGVIDNHPPPTKFAPIGTDTRSVYLGGRSGADLFDGLIDDVRLYNRALSAKEIEQVANAVTIKIISWTEQAP
ncbi:MAG: LamG domain-containing protein, partial [Planctomycetes bacterium]|nr:LamG domain-containing protein [Planctomycetota bacterium]